MIATENLSVAVWAVAGTLAIFAAACDGIIGDGPSAYDEPGVPPNGVPGAIGSTGDAPQTCGQGNGALAIPARLRRVTPAEYNRTIQTLLGPSVAFTPVDFPADAAEGTFHNGAATLRVTDLLAHQLADAAPDLAAKATANLGTLLRCDPAQLGENVCVNMFLEAFAHKAYRRPPTADELRRLTTVYQLGRDGGDVRSGIVLALEVVFQSPNLLYRTELGTPDATGDMTSLTADEVAAELSYLTTSGPPDDELVAAGARGDLTSADGREKEARRLLLTPAARPAVDAFADDWLGIFTVESLSKDSSRFPTFSADLAHSMRLETEALFEDVVFAGDGSLGSLLLADHTFVDSALAKLYGITGANIPASGSALSRVSLDPTKRIGVLTNAAVLATHSGNLDSSPTHRGKLIRNQLLCQAIPPPPPALMVKPAAPDPMLTTRERMAIHAANSQCAVCHSMMDPVGFAFEHFDAVGAYRDQENQRPIDANGALTGGTDADGPFTGAAGLAHLLAASTDVRTCFAKQWTMYAMAKTLSDDECALAGIASAFASGQETISDLLISVVRSESFVVRFVPKT